MSQPYALIKRRRKNCHAQCSHPCLVCVLQILGEAGIVVRRQGVTAAETVEALRLYEVRPLTGLWRLA